MADFQQCADAAIRAFVTKLDNDGVYLARWPVLVPGDPTDGWNATKPDWRVQADQIMDDFEHCCGVKIPRNRKHIDLLRSRKLSILSDYLVEQAELAVTQLRVRMAKARLTQLKSVPRVLP